jgi:hypothetical protein
MGPGQFTGSGSETIAGKQVLGGDAYLTNSQGSLHLQFDSGAFTRVGRRQRQGVPFVVVEATGKYGSFTGATGVGTTWNVPASPNRASTFSGYINNRSS